MKFTIRDLLLVTVIVALALGWWLDHREWVESYSTKSHESEIWEARSAELQNRADILAERLSTTPNSTTPTPATKSAPAVNP